MSLKIVVVVVLLLLVLVVVLVVVGTHCKNLKINLVKLYKGGAFKSLS